MIQKKFNRTLEVVDVLLHIVGVHIPGYENRTNFFCMMARVFPPAKGKVGSTLLRDAIKNRDKLAVMRGPVTPPQEEVYVKETVESDLQTVCFYRKSVQAAWGVSKKMIGTPTETAAKAMFRDGNIPTMMWFMGRMKKRWDMPKLFTACCESGNETALLWGFTHIKGSIETKLKMFCDQALRYHPSTMDKLFQWHNVKTFSPLMVYRLYMAIASSGITPYEEILTEREKLVIRHALGHIDEAMIGYSLYAEIVRKYMRIGSVDIMTGLFPRCLAIAKTDYELLEVAAMSGHISSVEWALYDRGLGMLHMIPSNEEERNTLATIKKNLVFTACKNGTMQGMEMAKYLIDIGMEPYATTDDVVTALGLAARRKIIDVLDFITATFSPTLESKHAIVTALKTSKHAKYSDIIQRVTYRKRRRLTSHAPHTYNNV